MLLPRDVRMVEKRYKFKAWYRYEHGCRSMYKASSPQPSPPEDLQRRRGRRLYDQQQAGQNAVLIE